jgi:hypothetical protein
MIMKKLVVTLLVIAAFSVPTLAQVDHDYNPNDVVIPEKGFALNEKNIPESVLKAVKSEFNLNVPSTWTKFPYALREYGWVYDKGASDVKPDRYQVSMKSKEGLDLYAVYSAEGNLIATREESTNIVVPDHVMKALQNSKYKDWTVVGNKQIIKYFHDKNSVEQHIRLTVVKDNVVRTISFNYQGKVGL